MGEEEKALDDARDDFGGGRVEERVGEGEAEIGAEGGGVDRRREICVELMEPRRLRLGSCEDILVVAYHTNIMERYSPSSETGERYGLRISSRRAASSGAGVVVTLASGSKSEATSSSTIGGSVSAKTKTCRTSYKAVSDIPGLKRNSSGVARHAREEEENERC